MADPARKLVTVQEFLRFEGEGDRRYELFGGEIVMMSPPARAHGVIVTRLGAALRARLRPPCEAQSEAGILLPWTGLSYYQADLAVSCAPMGREIWCPEPILIIEVLSSSTEQVDRTVKLRAYRRLPSVRHILLVSAEEASVEHYARSGPFWRLWDLGPGDTITLDGLGIEVPIDAIYDGLALPGPDADPTDITD